MSESEEPTGIPAEVNPNAFEPWASTWVSESQLRGMPQHSKEGRMSEQPEDEPKEHENNVELTPDEPDEFDKARAAAAVDTPPIDDSEVDDESELDEEDEEDGDDEPGLVAPEDRA